jgi:hypothetical protein
MVLEPCIVYMTDEHHILLLDCRFNPKHMYMEEEILEYGATSGWLVPKIMNAFVLASEQPIDVDCRWSFRYIHSFEQVGDLILGPSIPRTAQSTRVRACEFNDKFELTAYFGLYSK